jgi:hypothetical protein
MITKFGKRFLTSHMAGMVDFTTKDLALGIGDIAVNSEGNDTKLNFEFYRLPATLSSVDIRSANITGVAGNGTSITYTADNNFSVGQTIKITGISPAQYNLSSAVIASSTNTQFTVTNSATGAYASGGYASSYSVIYKATIPQDISGVISEVGLYPGSRKSNNNYDSKFITSFDNNLSWTDGSYNPVIVYKTDLFIPKIGDNMIAITTPASTAKEYTNSNTTFDISGYSVNDSIAIAYKKADDNVSRIRVKFYSSDTSYCWVDFTPELKGTTPDKFQPLTLNNLFSNVTATPPDLTSIIKIGVEVTASSGGATTVYFDGIRINDEDTFDPYFGLISRSVLTGGNILTKPSGRQVDIEYKLALEF